MLKKYGCTFALLGGFAITPAVNAATLAVTPADITGVDSIASFATGELMAGITVEVLFDDGTYEKEVWLASGPDAGSASGTFWSLEQTGDTFLSPWTLINRTNSGIKWLVINGLDGGISFDLDTSDAFGSTFGSSAGRTFDAISSSSPNFDTDGIRAVYSDAIYLNSDGPGSLARTMDSYGTVAIEFNTPFWMEQSFPSGVLTFNLDTDRINAIPVPAAAWLFGSGLIGLVGVARRRERK